MSPPNACEKVILFRESIVAVIFVNPAALIAFAINSASDVVPVAVNVIVTVELIVAIPVFDSETVNVKVPAAKVLAKTLLLTIAVAPELFFLYTLNVANFSAISVRLLCIYSDPSEIFAPPPVLSNEYIAQ